MKTLKQSINSVTVKHRFGKGSANSSEDDNNFVTTNLFLLQLTPYY